MGLSTPSLGRAPLALDLSVLEGLVCAHFGVAPTEVEEMPGGASTRRYFRAVTPRGAAVGMFVPEGAKPEEVQHAASPSRWPFLEVAELLEDRGVRVPRLYGADTDRGWLLLEDLGEDTLANFLLRRPQDRPAIYTRAVRDLARAQRRLAELPRGSIVSSRAFDVTLLRWEIEHFREWGLDARGASLPPGDSERFAAIADELAAHIAALPRSFVHRDYQSRNLMVVSRDAADAEDGLDVDLVWIDFQDALLGPRVYDLVALLNDSYQEFDRAFVEARIGEYADELGEGSPTTAELLGEFDRVTVQRKLKDAGRFVFIDREKGNPSFLRFVTPTIAKVSTSLDRLASGGDESARELLAILRRALPSEL